MTDGTADDSPGELLRRAPGFAVVLLRRWLARRRWELYFRRRPDHEALDGDSALDVVRDADSVLFLCWGNVCRSPMAERYLRQQLARRGVDGVEVRSAGLGEAEGRPSPEAAVAEAARHDVDLRTHESRTASERLLAQTDAVFVMDSNNFHSVLRQFPAVARPVFFLGAVAPDGAGWTISDPYRGDADDFADTYRVVTDAVDALAEAMADPRGGGSS